MTRKIIGNSTSSQALLEHLHKTNFVRAFDATGENKVRRREMFYYLPIVTLMYQPC